jgi:hypothetical protein
MRPSLGRPPSRPRFGRFLPSGERIQRGSLPRRDATGGADPTTHPLPLGRPGSWGMTEPSERASQRVERQVCGSRRGAGLLSWARRARGRGRPSRQNVHCGGRALWDPIKSSSFEEAAAVEDLKRQARNGHESSRRHPEESGRGSIGEAGLRPGHDGTGPFPPRCTYILLSILYRGGGGGDSFPERALRQPDGGAPISLVVWSPLVRAQVLRPKAVHYDKYKDLQYSRLWHVRACVSEIWEDHLTCAHYRFTQRRIRRRSRTGTERGRNRS